MSFQPSNRVFRVHIPDQGGSLMLCGGDKPPRGIKPSKRRVRRERGLHGGRVLHRERVCAYSLDRIVVQLLQGDSLSIARVAILQSLLSRRKQAAVQRQTVTSTAVRCDSETPINGSALWAQLAHSVELVPQVCCQTRLYHLPKGPSAH